MTNEHPKNDGKRYLKKWDIVETVVESPIQGQIQDPEDLYIFLKDLQNEQVSKIIAVYLDGNNLFLGHQVFVGHTSATLDTAHFYHYYLIFLAKRFMLLVNHPSGDSAPTDDDCKLMDKLYTDARMLSFKPDFADFIIVGDTTYCSMMIGGGKACRCGHQQYF